MKSAKFLVFMATFFISITAHAGWSKYKGMDLYTPANFEQASSKKVVLWLHGCTQSARGFGDFSHIVEEAEARGFLVLAPEQSLLTNPIKCWNWFLPGNNRRDGGKVKKIVTVLQELISEKSLDEENVAVGGFSAGGVLASNLASCYPDIFKAALIHSGGPYNLLKTLGKEENYIECPGVVKSSMRLKYVLIAHGEKDKISSHKFAYKSEEQFKTFFKVNEISDSAVELMMLPEMGHAWSGSKTGSVFSSPDTLGITHYFLDNI